MTKSREQYLAEATQIKAKDRSKTRLIEIVTEMRAKTPAVPYNQISAHLEEKGFLNSLERPWSEASLCGMYRDEQAKGIDAVVFVRQDAKDALRLPGIDESPEPRPTIEATPERPPQWSNEVAAMTCITPEIISWIMGLSNEDRKMVRAILGPADRD